jgi:hypothetical protein
MDNPKTIDEVLDAIRNLDSWGCGCCAYGSWDTYDDRIGDKEKVRKWIENLISSKDCD